MKDLDDFNIGKYFEETYEILSSALTKCSENKVLVHCAMGKSRSVAIIAMYLMKKNSWSFEKV